MDVTEAEAALAAALEAHRAATVALDNARRTLRIAQARAAADRLVEAGRRRRAARDKAKRLAAKLGVEIEQHADLDSRPWFVSHPELEGEADPYEGDHYVHCWEDVLTRVEGYERALAERTTTA